MVAAEDPSSLLTTKNQPNNPSTHPTSTPPSTSPPSHVISQPSPSKHPPPVALNKPQINRVEFLYTETPVEGCDLLPYVVIQTPSGEVKSAEAIEARTFGALSVQYRWNRCVSSYVCACPGCDKPARCQFVPLLKLAAKYALPQEYFDSLIRDSFYCSSEHMLACWDKLKMYMEKIPMSFSLRKQAHLFTPDEQIEGVLSQTVDNMKEEAFKDPLPNPVNVTEVAFIRNYAPTKDDVGHVLELVCRYVQKNNDGDVKFGPPVSVRSKRVRSVPKPPPERRMLSLGSGEKYSAKKKRQGTFRVLTYNILSEIYANKQQFPKCPSWALAWTFRKRNLIREMAQYDADIICLQELQADHYDDHFRPYFSRLGYDGVYKTKTRESMGRKGKIDGCATFYRKNMFVLRDQHVIEYNSIAQARTKESRTLNRCLKGNVGLILVLDVADGSGPLIIANTHLYWDPEFTDVKLFQIDVFMQELEMLIQRLHLPTDVGVIFAGDLNSEPSSSVYELISTGSCSLSKPDVSGDRYNVLASCRLQHNLRMRSSYSLTGQEPAFTNYTHSFIGALDYIWYGADSVVPTAILEMPDQSMLFGEDAETDAQGGIPNAQWSSDHVALVTEFQMMKRHSGLSHGTR